MILHAYNNIPIILSYQLFHCIYCIWHISYTCSLSIYICIRICIRICVSMYICIYVYMCVCIYVLYMYVYIYICMYICMYIYTYMYMYVYIYICVCVCMCICIRICLCICIHAAMSMLDFGCAESAVLVRKAPRLALGFNNMGEALAAIYCIPCHGDCYCSRHSAGCSHGYRHQAKLCHVLLAYVHDSAPLQTHLCFVTTLSATWYCVEEKVDRVCPTLKTCEVSKKSTHSPNLNEPQNLRPRAQDFQP